MNTNNKLKKVNSYRLSQEILRNKALRKGVNLIAPETIFLSKDTVFGKNVTVEPYVVIGSKVKIGDNSQIKSFTHIEGTKIEKNVVVGPYARLRSGTIMKNNTKVGNFVETKKTTIDSGYHFGSRLAIKDNFLFASAGERGQGMIAQDPTQHPGSIIRINIDGTIPKDNPKFQGKSDWLPEIYQIGVRNPQGLTISPFDNKIYLSNHGARGGDWFGEAKKGENYGWKILGWGGTNYSGIPIGPKWKPGFTKAIHYWVPSIATSAITIYKGEEFNEWNGHALITSLKDQSLRKLVFNDLSNVREDIIFKGKIGRIRDIQVDPNNGKIYFLAGDSLWLMEKS